MHWCILGLVVNVPAALYKFRVALHASLRRLQMNKNGDGMINQANFRYLKESVKIEKDAR